MAGNRPGENSGTLLLAVGDSPPSDWEELLAADENADYFHTTHWTCSARDHVPGVEAYWHTARLDGRLVGGLVGIKKSQPITRWESNLEGTSGGPLVDSSLSLEMLQQVFDSLVSSYLQKRDSGFGTTCLTLNHFQEKKFGLLLSHRQEAWQRADTPAAVIPLGGGLEHVEMSLMKKNKRNERNRALKRGARVEISHDPQLLSAYYPIYEKASERWNLPPAPLPFLQALLADENTVKGTTTRTFFTCILLDDEVIGGHLNLQYKKRVIAWNGVTEPQYARTHFPATLAVWGDIEESCRRGADVLDLGGSGGVVSLSGFKKNFGAKDENRGHYVLDSTGMKILRGGKKLLQGFRPGGASGQPRRWHDDNSNGPVNS